jgi:oligogalacturonide transport system permease protein
VINFIGVCIHTFHSMGNIFVMTGGGPNGATTVLSLAIWRHAFVNLDFSMATATAWILGSLLIGFTIYQLRFLQKVEFRRAEIN